MQFSIQANRNEHIEVTIAAPNIETALIRFAIDRPDFKPEIVTYLDDNGDPGESVEVATGRCEGCRKFIFVEENYTVDEDGIYLCSKCGAE